jgi:Haloacid Dehalogenase superfamily, subfamily IB, phosphoserine phosphatase-like/2,3-diketo-5-methylthio-1-phosphopentane phosphatase
MKKDNRNDLIVFFDFDNTITTIDVVDDMLGRFSKDDGWKEIEARWQRGDIGSRECLKEQVEGIRVEKNRLDKYISTIKIDPYFKRLLTLLGSRKIPYLIVSDNFDYVLKNILKHNGLSGLEVYCNKANYAENKFNPTFPYSNAKCGDCANCKKTHLLSRKSEGVTTVYVGDGRSDVCASKVADTVFAKDYLKKLFEKEGLPHIAISSLKDVYEYFERSLA